MTSKGMKIGVIGAGAWGTALAQVAAQGEREVVLWAREPEVVAAINESHENPLFLAGVPLSPAIRATGSLDDLAGLGALPVVRSEERRVGKQCVSMCRPRRSPFH